MLPKRWTAWQQRSRRIRLPRFLLHAGSNYREHLTHFFSLLARARIALGMPVLVARATSSIHGAAMGNTTAPPPWPSEFEDEWSRLELATPGFNDRAALYDEIAKRSKPPVPHYYLGVIGIGSGHAWARHGGAAAQVLLRSVGIGPAFRRGSPGNGQPIECAVLRARRLYRNGPRQPRQCNPMVHVPVPSIPGMTPNRSIERTSQRPLRALWPAAHVER